MRLVKYGPDNVTNLPVGGGAIVSGALLKRGATPGTNNGMLILAGGTSAIPDSIGILRQALATADKTLIDGTVFTTRPVQIIAPGRIIRMYYDLTSTITASSSSTTFTVSSLEDDIDASWQYAVSGTGAGQLQYAVASASGSLTMKAAFGTALSSTPCIKILPRFHQKAILNTDGTMLGSQAAVGSIEVMVIDTFMEKNNNLIPLNPVKHPGMTGLSSLRSIRFCADVVLRDTAFATID